jgi:hypothetical protein
LSTTDEQAKFLWKRYTATEVSDIGWMGPTLDHLGSRDR